MEIEEKFNKKLLVEGNDDQHVVWALCRQCGITESFDVRDCKSVDKAKKNLSISLKLVEIKTVGIVIDADIDLESRWDSVRNILIDNKFVVPEGLPREGLILNNGDKRSGVWIMPNNNTKGMLEDFISFLVPKNDKLLPVVDTTLNHIETQKLHQYADTHKSKAKIHTWLAWQENPGTPLGASITKRYLSTDDEICLSFVNWLNDLFNNQ